MRVSARTQSDRIPLHEHSTYRGWCWITPRRPGCGTGIRRPQWLRSWQRSPPTPKRIQTGWTCRRRYDATHEEMLTWFDADPVRYWCVAWVCFGILAVTALAPGILRLSAKD